MGRNSQMKPNKVASSEFYINRFLFITLICLVILVTLLFLLKRYCEIFIMPHRVYLGPTPNSYNFISFLQDYLSFLILFNYLIPVSMYVSIEMHRVMSSFLMEWDIELYDADEDQNCIVNTSNLNEDLGQINILFSDKTGTLTKNEMVFQKCSIDGCKFQYQSAKLLNLSTGSLLDINKFTTKQHNFFQALALCHTVQVGQELEATLPGFTEEKLRNNKSVSKRRFVGTSSRVFPSNVMKMEDNIADGRPITFPNRIQKLTENGNRPISFDLNSEMDLPSPMSGSSKRTHHRTQSHGTPSAGVDRTRSVFNRSSSFRESYALPNFIQSPSLRFLRAGSQRRKDRIQTIVEKLDYQASSPDEKALVESAAHLGLVFVGSDDGTLKIRFYPSHLDYSRPFSRVECIEMNFERLHILEFTSDRKRMSVIVRDENGIIWIYTKGAEGAVLPFCNKSSSDLIMKTNQHITDFAHQGLRTLVVARRRIVNEEYKKFADELNRAISSLENRKQLIEKCYVEIEKDLEILGATAVEDALQESIDDTLVSLQQAGIKIWVLTGDKMETALNISISCGHISPLTVKYFIRDCVDREEILIHLTTLSREIVFGCGRQFALLIDGKSLSIALRETPKEFRVVAIKCIAVVCCRLNPLQKSEVVALVKNSTQNFNTAAIGDGANDVAMIQEAHIGIGIIGKEGRQAARCADFAFSKFFMLKRLFLVHGHCHSVRISLLVLYFFYKNVFFVGIMFLYQFHTMFSSSSLYDSVFLTLYNVLYTSLPILFISFTEKPHSFEKLTNNPQLYRENANNKQLHWRYFIGWILAGVYQTIICFYSIFNFFSINNAILNDGQIGDFSSFGTILIQLVVIIVNLKLWLTSKFMSYWFITTVIGSILIFIVTTQIYNILHFRYDTDMYRVFNKLWGSVAVLLVTTVTVVACLVPDYILKITNEPKRKLFPDVRQENIFKKRQTETSYL